MSGIKTNSQITPEKLAGIGVGCWVCLKDEYLPPDKSWRLVVELYYRESRITVWDWDNNDWAFVEKTEILAIHEPTRTPDLATAYKIGEPDEVTREQLRSMVCKGCRVYVGGGWYSPHEFEKTGHWQVAYHGRYLGLNSLRIEGVSLPGGNVYAIKKEGE